MNYEGAAFVIAAVALALFILHALTRRDKCSTSSINLEDLLLGDDGKMSKAATVLLGAFAATTLILVYQAWKGTLTDMTYGAYLAAWVAPTVTRLIVNGKTT